MNKEWWDNFKGQCIACSHAIPSTKKNRMVCQNYKAWNKGLPNRPGGTKMGEEVSKLFGCVYFITGDRYERHEEQEKQKK